MQRLDRAQPRLSNIISAREDWKWKYTPSFTDIMPEILEESTQAVWGAGWVRVWRPLLCVIGSARPVAFPMHLHLRCLPQLPSVWKEWRLKRDLKWAKKYLNYSCVSTRCLTDKRHNNKLLLSLFLNQRTIKTGTWGTLLLIQEL